MEEFSSAFWDVVGIGVPILIVGVLLAGLIKVLAGNESYKQQGWGHFKTLLTVVLLGFCISMFFPSVRETLTKTMKDPCGLFNVQCRR